MYSLVGTVVGLALLLPAYAIGGMGAGDVKLLAGVGAWVWGTTTLYAFAVSAIVGGVIAVLHGAGRQRSWDKHQTQFWMICNEILTVKDPEKLAAIAAERKSQHDAAAVRHSDRHRHDRLLRRGRNAAVDCMKRDAVASATDEIDRQSEHAKFPASFASADAAVNCGDRCRRGELPEPDMLIVPKKPTRFRLRSC